MFYSYEDALAASIEYFNGDELAARSFVDKYALRDNDLNLLEKTPEDMHRRIAREFARAEAKKYASTKTKPLTEDEIFSYLNRFKKIIPQGSPMYGIGNEHQFISLSNCVHGESLVYTLENGLIKMSEVKAGIHVLTHLNRFKKVLRHWSNGFKDTYTVCRSFTDKRPNVWNEQEMSRFLSATPEHRVYTKSGDWITIEELFGKHDKDLAIPCVKYEGSVCSIFPLGMGRHVEVDDDFGWISGLYLAEGGIKKRVTNNKVVYFTLNISEKEYVERIENFCVKVFGVKPWVQYWPDFNFIQVNIFDDAFADLLMKLFGHGFNKKRLPQWMFGIDESVKKSVIDGFMSGDATNYESLDDVFVFTIANPTLSYELGMLCRSVGKNVRFNFLNKGKLIKNRTVTASISDKPEKIACVKSPIKAEVFDMEVEEDHSFVAGDIVCHNCFVVESPVDSYGGICKTDEELVQISKRRGGDGADITNIRPINSITHNAARTSTGIIPFMDRFSNSIREVGQNGRRGALMLSISVHHPESVKLLPDGEKPKDIVVNEGTDREIKTTTEFYDPNNLDFATVKYDKTRVTGANISIRLSDEFLTAVDAGTTYEQRWPVDWRTTSLKAPVISQQIDARRVWNKIVRSAWQMAEPGLLFWDNILRESPADCYAELGFRTISTNPCTTGDTLVYVADGRGDVKISELAKEGKDVPVFCYDDKGKVVIRTMRNPRLTGYKQQIFKLTLEDGLTIRVTGNHKFLLTDGTYKQVKDMVAGDSIKILTKYEASWKDITSSVNSSSQDYVWLNSGFASNISEHTVIANHFFGAIPKGSVVHHNDRNGLNNSPSNLEVMTREAHDRLHGNLMMGDNNPMRRAKTEWSEEKWKEYSTNMSEATSGDKNGKYSGFSNDEIAQHALDLTESLGYRFSNKVWASYAKKHGLPQSFSVFRQSVWKSVTELGVWAANELGIVSDVDPRLQKTLLIAAHQGYEARIEENHVLVEKICEHCKNTFETEYQLREIGFCSRTCSNHYLNSRGTKEKKMKLTKIKQVKVYTDLKFKFSRDPKQSEWEAACKEQHISYRVGRKLKYGFQSYSQVKEEAQLFNHRVVSIELDGNEDVYNGTVDDFHNFFVGGWESKCKNGKRKSLYINNLQCGEIPLSAYDSCRLLVLNLLSFVRNPFTKNAYFDFKDFFETTKIAQRLMDDLIDLEVEKINDIIKKVGADPENKEIKQRELALWKKILDACIQGRRTGTGITALGDAIAALGLSYGSDDGIAMTERIYKTLKFGAYSASIEMSKVLGAFPVWDHQLEKDNPFLNRIKEEFCDLTPSNSDKADEKEFIVGEHLWNEMKKHGRRNIALLTTAPTGTVSILTQTTSGIEPLFMVSYTRRKKGNPGDNNFRSDFKDQSGDHWMEFPVFHSRVWDWANANNLNEELTRLVNSTDDKLIVQAQISQLLSRSPWNGSCAGEIDWTQRVKLQAAAQRHVDHSISSTVNLPKDVTVEKVDEIYRTAWKAGLKGITIYRDGCRTGVLVGKSDATKRIKKTNAPQRPVSMPCDVFHIKARGESYFVLVGLMDDTDPYEVFAGKNGMIGKNVSKGTLIKRTKGKYDASFDDGTELKNVAEYLSDEEEAITRMVSTALRHGADIQFVVHQLENTRGNLFGFSKAVARALRTYLHDKPQATGEKCPDCSGLLIRAEGCTHCQSCSYSKCG